MRVLLHQTSIIQVVFFFHICFRKKMSKLSLIKRNMNIAAKTGITWYPTVRAHYDVFILVCGNRVHVRGRDRT
jgi:hypothetical protein